METVASEPSAPMISMGRVVVGLMGSARLASDQKAETASAQSISTRRHVPCSLESTCMHFQSANFQIP